MKDNSKSGPCTKRILVVLIALILVGSLIQLFVNHSEIKHITTGNVNEEFIIENNILEEIKIAKAEERQLQTTSRSANEREIQKEEKVIEESYISIEEITISRDMDLSKRCGISKEDFKELMRNLKVDYSGFFYENSDTIYELCKEYELNEIFFCGLIAGESGWNIASNHRKTNNYISMMSKGKLIHYSTPAEGLEAAAKLLHKNYLTEGGAYYSGKTLSNVQKRFCPNSSTWVGLIYGCMKQIVK